MTQNIGTVWGQIRVSTINLDITEDEFNQITRAMAQTTEHLLGPNSEIRKRLDARNQYSPLVQQAFRDWNDKRAYVDNGRNYRVTSESATPTHRPSGKIAPWNKEVKRLFPSCAEFHAAAQEHGK